MRTEILTYQHRATFADLYKQNSMIGNVVRFKVMEYSESQARVYYVDEFGGYLLYFANIAGQWKFYTWKAIWSKQGSADDFIWPYIR